MTSQRFVGPLAAMWPAASPEGLRTSLRGPDTALPVPSADDRSTWDLTAGSVDHVTFDDLRRRADADLGRAWPQPSPRGYARYFRDGDRDDYEQAVFARQQRLSRAAVVAAVTLDPTWIDEVADGITLLCEQSSWCWPAHDDTHRVHGAVVPTVTDPFLDLGAGEVVGQLAWIDQLLGTQLDDRVPGLRARVRHEARVRVLDPFVRRRDWHWLGLDGDVHNWNPWIHGNVLVAVLRLVEDPVERARLVALVVEGIDRYVAALPPDGAVDEGYSYWWNGACRALEALEVLTHAAGGALDVTAVPALCATVAFPHRMHLGGDWYLNLADGPARPPSDQPWHALHRAAVRVGDEDARRHAAAHRRPGAPAADERAGLGRLLQALTDRTWLAAGPEASPLPRDVWLASTQVLVARGSAGTPRGLTVAVKGGHNGEHHNHNDVGSVVVALDGVPVVVDAGRPTYTARTFGDDRYGIWTMQSSWHNVPEIRGTTQSPGHRFGAREVSTETDDDHAQLRLDLGGAYSRTDVRHWWRTVRLDRTPDAAPQRAAERVTLTDTWELDDAAGAPPSTVRLLLAGDVVVGTGRVLITAPANAGTVILSWEPGTAAAAVEVRELDDPLLSDVWGARLTRLTIEVGDAPSGTLTVTVKEDR
ncbi:heparinase II/III family protein [Cellulomonas sp. KRMCY2]|uniref:heparinase II/III domain-containing protein n=1 Tax=Cellulomonas sp. KRMCY2 TaxID=1304865 RepID=UPI00045E91F1|nr:heparinase II/III family protein [Cellulomonas sp. KRMCY2]